MPVKTVEQSFALNPRSSPPPLMETKSGRLTASDDCSDSLEVNGDPHRIWLGCLPTRITEFAVLQLAKQFGELSDFHFPVHKTGDLQGSTVGYCFLTYKSVDDAKKAWKGLDGLNFHGYTLVARPARPTKDELTVAQRASDEATKLRIIEEAKQREAQLAVIMGIYDPMQLMSSTHLNECFDKTLPMENSINTPTVSSSNDTFTNSSSLLSSRVSIPDLYGKLGLNQNCQQSTSHVINNTHRSKHQEVETKAAIHRLEMALKILEKTPVGGADSLKPITDGHNPYSGTLILKSNQKNRNARSPSTSAVTMAAAVGSLFGRNQTKSHNNSGLLLKHNSRPLLNSEKLSKSSTKTLHQHCSRPNSQVIKRHSQKRDLISRHF
ncbi:unnamed protein product [Trichobilharzia szidati]|nr:unnamed protein product [Trichobilharzia szidati]